ncbi:hypothetical protein RJT34_14505 [Clitoria ternatea]|uniref:Wall-associated receptor kinase galacturonan-binding domain-containing protein n=1 Tax=Clitoria ternatea TaxID=43366 RepID=A0AAN9JQJ1_CLITE
MLVKFLFYIIISITWPVYPQASAQFDHTHAAKPGCNQWCGSWPIPYPFGMNDPECSADKWFEIECRNTSGDQTPYLKYINMEVTAFGTSIVWIKNPIYRRNCSRSKDVGDIINLEGGPFVYSQVATTLHFCNRMGQRSVAVRGNDQCGYALIVARYQGSKYDYLFVGDDLRDLDNVDAVLEWEILNNSTLKLPANAYSRCYPTNITSSSGWRCTCLDGFDGNPYIGGGCVEGMIQL